MGVAVVTGAGRGIGRATAKALIAQGMKVAIGDVDLETARQTASELGASTVALALDAELVARSSRGERTIAAADFFLGFLTTALAPDELLTEVRGPGLPAGHGAAFVELARRHGDFAVVGVAAAVALNGNGSIVDARLAFIGVGGTPVRAREAEALLRGAMPESAVFAEAAERAKDELDPGSDTHASAAYRRRVAGVLAQRALQEATS